MKYEKFCSDCKLQRKSENCRKCHDYWVAKYEIMHKAQAAANGKNGALQAKVNIAMDRKDKADLELEISKTTIVRAAVLSKHLKNLVEATIREIEHVSIFGRKKTLQRVWNVLKDYLTEADK